MPALVSGAWGVIVPLWVLIFFTYSWQGRFWGF